MPEKVYDIWGEELEISPSEEAKNIIKKASQPKKIKVKDALTEKSLKLKSVSINDKLEIIRTNVHRILGVYEANTVVIHTKEQLRDYIDNAIKNGIIAIDTETNNSLDPISCKLMGPCLYTPGQKNAYIPINHVDVDTRERLPNQITEDDFAKEIQRIINAKNGVKGGWVPDYEGQSYNEWWDANVGINLPKQDVTIIFHNGKFDYEVIKCTCGVALPIDWDTLIAAKLIDENERAGLKEQYITKIDPSIEKYSIEHLFEGIEYAVVDPDIFALYAATDAYMTYKLYLWQKEELEKPDNARILKLLLEIEVPVITVAAEMELAGVSIDSEYAKRLSAKYHKKLEVVDKQIQDELEKYSATIDKWRTTTAANEATCTTKKVKGVVKEVKGKSKNEQLEDPVGINSPIQLAILLYDVLKCEPVDPKNPRGTGEELLEALDKKYDIPLCKYILEKRGIEKLLGTYIDKLPECVSPVDNRLHAKFNQYGADTGRFSSSDPNLQNIPSHEKSIRMLFKAATEYHEVEEKDNTYIIPCTDEILTTRGWIKIKELSIGDTICGDETQDLVKNISIDSEKNYVVSV